ncbi:MAG: DNA repair protein RecO [Fimbriimonadaceae bacterium]|nr:DNA repair protein RecO [Fimbriimonadaceae bacterium]
MSEVTAKAVVLRRSDSGESDRRLVVLTREFGKIDLIAKGARKSGSRLTGSSEPLTLATFTWAAGKVRRFVTQVQPVTSYPHIRQDYGRLLAAGAVVELANSSLPFESPLPSVFDQVVESLRLLDEPRPWAPILVWTLERLLGEEGQGQSWTVCALTGVKILSNPAWCSPGSGGYVADPESAPRGFWVSAEALMALGKVGSLPEPPATIKRAPECLRVLVRVWQHVLETRCPACESALDALEQERAPNQTLDTD